MSPDVQILMFIALAFVFVGLIGYAVDQLGGSDIAIGAAMFLAAMIFIVVYTVYAIATVGDATVQITEAIATVVSYQTPTPTR